MNNTEYIVKAVVDAVNDDTGISKREAVHTLAALCSFLNKGVPDNDPEIRKIHREVWTSSWNRIGGSH